MPSFPARWLPAWQALWALDRERPLIVPPMGGTVIFRPLPRTVMRSELETMELSQSEVALQLDLLVELDVERLEGMNRG